MLVSLLVEQPEEILINVSGAIYEIAKADLEANAIHMKKANAIAPLLALLTRSNTVFEIVLKYLALLNLFYQGFAG